MKTACRMGMVLLAVCLTHAPLSALAGKVTLFNDVKVDWSTNTITSAPTSHLLTGLWRHAHPGYLAHQLVIGNKAYSADRAGRLYERTPLGGLRSVRGSAIPLGATIKIPAGVYNDFHFGPVTLPRSETFVVMQHPDASGNVGMLVPTSLARKK